MIRYGIGYQDILIRFIMWDGDPETWLPPSNLSVVPAPEWATLGDFMTQSNGVVTYYPKIGQPTMSFLLFSTLWTKGIITDDEASVMVTCMDLYNWASG